MLQRLPNCGIIAPLSGDSQWSAACSSTYWNPVYLRDLFRCILTRRVFHRYNRSEGSGRTCTSKRIVKVQLVYPKGRIGESADITVEDGAFRVPILFLTQSRSPVLNWNIPPEKCTQKPKTVVVSLIANNQEYDHVSLDMAQDFQKIELSTYVLRAEIVLQYAP